ncbi:MAG: septation protein IspZ [Bdellovibrionota bacterium]
MQRQFFIALFPLVLFWVVEEFFGLKVALIVGLITAILELGYEKYSQKKIGFMTWVSNGLILGLGLVSLAMNSGTAFKLQPAVMELALALVMVAMRFGGRESFLVRSFREFPAFDAKKRDFLMNQPWFQEQVRKLDTRMIGFLVIHGLAVAWAAVWGSTRIWILLKGVLFYVLLVLVMAPMYKRPRGNPAQ